MNKETLATLIALQNRLIDLTDLKESLDKGKNTCDAYAFALNARTICKLNAAVSALHDVLDLIPVSYAFNWFNLDESASCKPSYALGINPESRVTGEELVKRNAYAVVDKNRYVWAVYELPEDAITDVMVLKGLAHVVDNRWKPIKLEIASSK